MVVAPWVSSERHDIQHHYLTSRTNIINLVFLVRFAYASACPLSLKPFLVSVNPGEMMNTIHSLLGRL